MKNESKNMGSTLENQDNSSDEMTYCTASLRSLLIVIGIWPIERDATTIQKINVEIRIIICYLFLFFLIIPSALHIFLEEKNVQAKIKIIGPLVFYIVTTSKYSFLLLRRNLVRECLNLMIADWRRAKNFPTDRAIMLTSAQLNRVVFSVCAVLMYGAGAFYRIVVPFTIKHSAAKNNLTIRPLSSPIYKPLFTVTDTRSYAIVFTVQALSGLVVYTIVVSLPSLAAIFVSHARGQLNIVCNRLDNFIGANEPDEKNILDKRMAEIVELHLRALGFIMRIEDMYNEICLFEFVGCMFNMCLCGYNLIVELSDAETIRVITYSVILFSFTFNIFIFCFIGEVLVQQGNKVGATVYMIDWYKLSAKDAKSLILLLAMTANPCRITAGKMAELSYTSFSTVLKTAMGYFNLLRSVTM